MQTGAVSGRGISGPLKYKPGWASQPQRYTCRPDKSETTPKNNNFLIILTFD